MRRHKVMTLAATGAVSVAMLLSGSGAASAASNPSFPNSGYGFDGNANLIVGGGSTTLFRMAQSLATLWEGTASCSTNNGSYNAAGSTPTYPQTSPAFNQCETGTTATTASNPQSYNGGNAGGDFDGDTVAIATSSGSSTGIASLNGDHGGGTTATYAYEGTNETLPTQGDPNSQNGLSNGYGTVDFALSSRGPKTSGGNCKGTNPNSSKTGDELVCDTFWGVASDGVEVMTFDSNAGAYNNSTDGGGFSAQDLYNVYTCATTTWGQLPEWQAENAAGQSGLPDANAPIVPWSINSSSGTLGDFENYINANVPAANNSFNPDSYSCARELSGGALPLENDVKPIILDAQNNSFTPPAYPNGTTSPYPNGATYPAGLSTGGDSPQNPVNWLWFGSYGLLTEFPYLAGSTGTGTEAAVPAFNTSPVPIASGSSSTGIQPSSQTILLDTYPIGRVLSLVTAKSDADCPLTSNVCNFSANPGPNNGNGTADLNVLGATSGKGGATREFIRFLCRSGSAAQPTDPYTGTNLSTEIKSAILSSGFEQVPSALKSPGSSCDVISTSSS